MTTLFRIAISAGSFLVLLWLPAFGQADKGAAIASLSSQLDGENAAKAEALQTISATDEQAGPKLKEVKLWNDQLTGMKPQIDYVVEKRKRHDADAAVVNQKVSAHNANCHGTLPKPQFERCKGEEPYLQSQITRINNQKAQVDTEINNVRTRVKNIESRRDSLVSELQQIKSRQDAARARLATAEQRIAAITARLRQACNEGGSPEALAYCGQVDWDGARRGLTRPNLQPRPFSASPN
jgi:chromosome segregation ATPase